MTRILIALLIGITAAALIDWLLPGVGAWRRTAVLAVGSLAGVFIDNLDLARFLKEKQP